MCKPAAPNLMKDLTVRAMLNAPPQPVSASTRSGRAHASLMRRISTSTSSRVLMPRSGTPSELAATPPPDRYSALNPEASASRAAYALMAPTTCSGRSAATAARNRAPGELMGVDSFACIIGSLPRIQQNYRGWGASSLQAAAEFSRRSAGPFAKCAVKGAALGKSQFQRDIHDAAVRMTQITDGQIAPQLVLDPLVGGTLFVQTAAQGCGRHV